MKTISSIMNIVAKSIAIVAATPLLPVIALMWVIALLNQDEEPEFNVQVANAGVAI